MEKKTVKFDESRKVVLSKNMFVDEKNWQLLTKKVLEVPDSVDHIVICFDEAEVTDYSERTQSMRRDSLIHAYGWVVLIPYIGLLWWLERNHR